MNLAILKWTHVDYNGIFFFVAHLMAIAVWTVFLFLEATMLQDSSSTLIVQAVVTGLWLPG